MVHSKWSFDVLSLTKFVFLGLLCHNIHVFLIQSHSSLNTIKLSLLEVDMVVVFSLVVYLVQEWSVPSHLKLLPCSDLSWEFFLFRERKKINLFVLFCFIHYSKCVSWNVVRNSNLASTQILSKKFLLKWDWHFLMVAFTVPRTASSSILHLFYNTNWIIPEKDLID